MAIQHVFFTDNIQIKSDSKRYYVEGYISTKDKDLYNDVVTDDCLLDMVNQLKEKNIKLDIDHEAWNKSSRLIPVGRIIDAEKDDKGIYVRAEINKNKKEFKEVWNSIKDKFLDAFSIAYKVIEHSTEILNDEAVRILNKVELVNVALTGNPVNTNAKMMKVFMKSLKSEDNKMVEEQTEQKGESVDYKKKYEDMKSKCEELDKELKAMKEKKSEDVESEEEDSDDNSKEEKEKKSVNSDNLEIKSLSDSIVELKSAVELKNKEIAELKSKVEEMESKPELKAVMDKLNEFSDSKEEKVEQGPQYLF